MAIFNLFMLIFYPVQSIFEKSNALLVFASSAITIA
jgi:hypothetical protein